MPVLGLVAVELGLLSLIACEILAGTERIGVVSALVRIGAGAGALQWGQLVVSMLAERWPYLLVGVGAGAASALESLTGARLEAPEIDSLLDLSLLNALLALLINLARP